MGFIGAAFRERRRLRAAISIINRALDTRAPACVLADRIASACSTTRRSGFCSRNYRALNASEGTLPDLCALKPGRPGTVALDYKQGQCNFSISLKTRPAQRFDPSVQAPRKSYTDPVYFFGYVLRPSRVWYMADNHQAIASIKCPTGLEAGFTLISMS